MAGLRKTSVERGERERAEAHRARIRVMGRPEVAGRGNIT
jgi:hypothetical protein